MGTFIRYHKKKNGRQYRALVEDYRDDKGRPRQKQLKWLGPVGGYKRKRRLGKNTPAHDIGGAFMLGLPFRIVYDLVSGRRIEELKERMAQPNFFGVQASDPRGWRPPTLQAALQKSWEVRQAAWVKEMTRIRSAEERAKDEEVRTSLRAFSERLKAAPAPGYNAQARFLELRDTNKQHYASYNATIAAHFEQVDAANIKYAREKGLTSPQYGVAPTPQASAPQAASTPSASPPASQEDAGESSLPE
jgi:hypothetical protein